MSLCDPHIIIDDDNSNKNKIKIKPTANNPLDSKFKIKYSKRLSAFFFSLFLDKLFFSVIKTTLISFYHSEGEEDEKKYTRLVKSIDFLQIILLTNLNSMITITLFSIIWMYQIFF